MPCLLTCSSRVCPSLCWGLSWYYATKTENTFNKIWYTTSSISSLSFVYNTRYIWSHFLLQLLPKDKQEVFKTLLHDHFKFVKNYLLLEHKEMHKRARKDRQILQVSQQIVIRHDNVFSLRTKENYLPRDKKKMKKLKRVMRNYSLMLPHSQ